MSLKSPQQVGNFPVYGEVTVKRVWWILDITRWSRSSGPVTTWMGDLLTDKPPQYVIM